MTTAFDRATARPAITLPNLRRLPLRAIGIAGAAAVAIAAGATWIAAPASSVSTDDAYVKADSTIVAPRVQGLISEILVRDNQTVTAGAGPHRSRGLSAGRERRRSRRRLRRIRVGAAIRASRACVGQ